MTMVVVSQPLFFPWVGLFEQVRLADVYVHYDDVQLPQGRSFINRVQLKVAGAQPKWLTVPLSRVGRQNISEVRVDSSQNWRNDHLQTLYHTYARAPFVDEMLEIVKGVYDLQTDLLCEINIAGIERISKYLQLKPLFVRSSQLGIEGSSSLRLLNIVQRQNGTRYLTGHGALNYLDHELFEANGISVEYINYLKKSYSQLSGAFNPYVSVLDLIANVGKSAAGYLSSEGISWKEFVNGSENTVC